MTRWIGKHAWNIGLAALLAALLGVTKLIQPEFGVSGVESLTRAALPFAFATAAMAVVVIVGGIDLSVASMMAVTGVTAAVLMQHAGDGSSVAVTFLTLLVGVAMGTVNGSLVVLTKVPDIVVTLAMLFVWEGVALLILEAPGGAVADWLMAAVVGGLGGVVDWVPRALILMVFCISVVWVPIKRSRLGLSIYATGSDRAAAFRSGVAVGRTRVAAYAVAGLFCALGGLSLTMITGIGEPVPGPYLLASVAAVVLGGVTLGGGRGGLLGPIIAVFILRLIRLMLTLMAVDPNVTTIVEGAIMVIVVMIGGLLTLKGRRR
ncbi:MAG: ABC transporter permease [Rhodobacter sp.]|nr:ABC transporter permease [Rhodobacter sp.]MCY4167183.1 ABC transporter permease [Rhodobacter sp.]MCY4243660.1 ABC transporter permease [Rhodobacter sp.]